MSCQIDHFMYAVPSLDEGMQWAQDTFGVAPAYGGEHIGMGTCNALLSLGETYLEIIAPDPAQSLSGNLGAKFADLSAGGLVTFAVQGALSEIATVLTNHGIDSRGPNRTQRKTTSGEVLVWELLIPTRTSFGARLPFFIDWLDCPHPAGTNPMAGQFEELIIRDPEATALSAVFGDIGLSQTVDSGDPSLVARLSVAGQSIELSSTAETNAISMG